jgi:membrane-bound inhibitor of C-type lysozyme
MSGAGLVSPLILAGSAAMLVAGGALFVISKGLVPLIGINFGKAFSKNGLFGASGQTGFLGGSKTNLEVIIESLRDSFALSPFTIPLVIAGSAAMILVGKALNSIAIGLVKFQELSKGINTASLALNIGFMTSVLSNTFSAIGNKYKGGFLFGSNPVADGINAVMGMGSALSSIATGMQNMANLRFPVEYDKDGNPTKFKSMDSDAPFKVATNAKLITGTLSTVFSAIGNKYKGGFLFGSNPVADGINAVRGIGSALVGIAMGFQSMANLNFPIAFDKDGKPTKFAKIDNLEASSQRVANNTKLIVSSLSSTFSKIGKGDTTSWWEASSFEKGVAVVNALGLPLKNLAIGVSQMADMKFANGYDKNGKATGWTSLSDMEPEALKKKIGSNTQCLIEALTDTFTAIGGGKAKSSSWWQGTTAFEKGIEVVNLIAEPYKKLGAAVKDLDSFNNINSVKIKTDLQNLIAGFTTVGESSDTTTLTNASKLAIAVGDTYTKMSKAIPAIAKAKMDTKTGDIFSNLLFGVVDKGEASIGYYNQMKMQHALASTYGKAGENFPKIQGAINSLDITKLTESRKMFEALAVLSKGGSPGDILAQMGESLESAMQRLANMLEEFKGSVEESGASNNMAFEGITNAVNSVGSAMTPMRDNVIASQSPIQFPTKMKVSLDQISIDALRDTGFGGGQS